MLSEPGAGQRPQQEDSKRRRAEDHRQGNHQLQRRLQAGLRAAGAGEASATANMRVEERVCFFSAGVAVT